MFQMEEATTQYSFSLWIDANRLFSFSNQMHVKGDICLSQGLGFLEGPCVVLIQDNGFFYTL